MMPRSMNLRGRPFIPPAESYAATSKFIHETGAPE